ncbi:MAG: carbohydrate-binding domain-containing protein [Lachnospiraceae bacterium]|nr:carbohydrate-binding domain-containing protein [Lachnospiraceae bacterium]
MSYGKKFDRICIIVMLCAVLVTALFMNGEALGMEVIVDKDSESYTGTEYFTDNDLDGDWDDTDAVSIILEGDTARIIGNGAYANDGNVYITSSGYYTISGELTDGSIIVDAYQSSKIWIMLDGVSVYCSDDAALRVDQADKVFLTLKEGTESTLASGETYSEEAVEDGTGGAIYSHDDLTINGSGKLTVTAEYKHGIECNDSLVITGGEIDVTAPQDGIHANDSLRLTGANVTISSGDDGVHCDTEIIIDGGVLLIEECYEGLESQQITVTDGEITIYSSDDGFNANGGTTSEFGMGGMGGRMANTEEGTEGSGEAADRTDVGTEGSAETAETTSGIYISGGTITIINGSGRDADGLDSNGDIYISGGTIRVSLNADGSNNAIDYASENGGVCVITGGEVIACGSYSMAEAFDSGSTQCAILYNFSETAEAGTTFAVEDTDGSVLLTYDVPNSFSSVNVSSPLLELGETYLIVIGDNVEEITLEETSASYGDAQSIMFGGTMNWGGMQKRGGFGGHGGMNGMGGMAGMKNNSTDGDAGSDESSNEMQMPDPPEGMEAGEMPDPPEGMEAGQMPEPPEGMEAGEMPEPPEGMEAGEMPEPPEGMENGEMPEPPEGMKAGEMPEPPEGMEAGEMPEQPEGMGHGGMGPGAAQAEEQAAAENTVADYDAETWIWFAACVALLVLGITGASKFKRGREI